MLIWSDALLYNPFDYLCGFLLMKYIQNIFVKTNFTIMTMISILQWETPVGKMMVPWNNCKTNVSLYYCKCHQREVVIPMETFIIEKFSIEKIEKQCQVAGYQSRGNNDLTNALLQNSPLKNQLRNYAITERVSVCRINHLWDRSSALLNRYKREPNRNECILCNRSDAILSVTAQVVQ